MCQISTFNNFWPPEWGKTGQNQSRLEPATYWHLMGTPWTKVHKSQTVPDSILFWQPVYRISVARLCWFRWQRHWQTNGKAQVSVYDVVTTSWVQFSWVVAVWTVATGLWTRVVNWTNQSLYTTWHSNTCLSVSCTVWHSLAYSDVIDSSCALVMLKILPSLFRGALPSVLWHCWLVIMKSTRPVKYEWWGAGMVICLERGAYGPADATATPLFLASLKSRFV